jgi:hypothetical protein
MATQNLYIEWMRNMLGEQLRVQGEFWRASTTAQAHGEELPEPQDFLDGHRAALAQVLPHLQLVRLDQDERRLIYDSAGSELIYEDLSGGERELAFLVGQMERFGIKDGLFLLDEPELHLNAALLRRWLGYLRSATEAGQVWIATHSLEAVEVAGLTSTLVMDRDPDRTVRRADPLGERPALQTLAPLLGTPAFSLQGTTFVLIEGDRPGRERERFVEVTGLGPEIRFVEAGSCNEVARHFTGLALVADEAEQLRIQAFIDRDHRSDAQVESLEREYGVAVLLVHEIENFYLHPDLLDVLLTQGGRTPEGNQLLLDAADAIAGRWIWQRAVTRKGWKAPPGQSIEIARRLSWDQVDADRGKATGELLEHFDDDAEGETKAGRRTAISAAITEYAGLRENRDRLWREVEGKETLEKVAKELGFADPEAHESRAAKLWREDAVARPSEVAALVQAIDDAPLRG